MAGMEDITTAMAAGTMMVQTKAAIQEAGITAVEMMQIEMIIIQPLLLIIKTEESKMEITVGAEDRVMKPIRIIMAREETIPAEEI
jgi:hypothetical protein